MDRLTKLREAMQKMDLDGMLITAPQNQRYLSGFSGGEGALLIGADTAVIVTDFRYWEQVAQEVKAFTLHKQTEKLLPTIARLLTEMKWRRIGFESAQVTFGEYQLLRELIPAGQELIPAGEMVAEIRWIKDAEEIELLAQAEAITDRAWQATMQLIKAGVQERELALEFDYQIRKNGAEGNSFTTIVASGFRGALPHASASSKTIAPGELVTLDGGALYHGYCADLTRTVVLGKADPKQHEVYQTVLEAQERALKVLRAGMIGSKVDAVARDYIAGRGYGANFGHGLGHSVALQIHEEPRLSLTETHEIPVGAVITVEPGIYLPGWGGVRIEDLVVVETDGIRNLTNSPKQNLIEL